MNESIKPIKHNKEKKEYSIKVRRENDKKKTLRMKYMKQIMKEMGKNIYKEY